MTFWSVLNGCLAPLMCTEKMVSNRNSSMQSRSDLVHYESSNQTVYNAGQTAWGKKNLMTQMGSLYSEWMSASDWRPWSPCFGAELECTETPGKNANEGERQIETLATNFFFKCSCLYRNKILSSFFLTPCSSEQKCLSFSFNLDLGTQSSASFQICTDMHTCSSQPDTSWWNKVSNNISSFGAWGPAERQTTVQRGQNDCHQPSSMIPIA